MHRFPKNGAFVSSFATQNPEKGRLSEQNVRNDASEGFGAGLIQLFARSDPSGEAMLRACAYVTCEYRDYIQIFRPAGRS